MDSFRPFDCFFRLYSPLGLRVDKRGYLSVLIVRFSVQLQY